MGLHQERQFSHWVMEQFGVFTIVKYAMEIITEKHIFGDQNLTKVSGEFMDS
jgi:hypothetical protein